MEKKSEMSHGRWFCYSLVLALSFALSACYQRIKAVESERTPPPAETPPAHKKPRPPAPGQWVAPTDETSDYNLCLHKTINANNYTKELTLSRVQQRVRHFNCKNEITRDEYQDMVKPNSDFWFKKIELPESSVPLFPRFQVYNGSSGTCNSFVKYGGSALHPNMTVDIAPTTFNFHVEEGVNLLQYTLEVCPDLDRQTWICPNPKVVEIGTLALTIHHEVTRRANSDYTDDRPSAEACQNPK